MRYARGKEVLTYKVNAEGQRGFPDVFLAYKGQVVLVEMKHPNGKGVLSPAQNATIDKLRQHNIPVKVIHRAEDFIDVITRLIEP
jgi:hypothetical protein